MKRRNLMKQDLNLILKKTKVIAKLFVMIILPLIPIFVFAQNTNTNPKKENTLHQESNQRIAVLNLLNQAQLKPQEIEYLTNLIRQSFAEKADQRFLLMTQENITLLLPPDKKMEDCLQECEVETGRVLGAKYIITGAILIFSETYRLNIKVHNTENGALVTSKVLKGKNLEELENSIQQASFELFEKIDEKQSNAKNLVATIPPTNPKPITLQSLPAQATTQATRSTSQVIGSASKIGLEPNIEEQIKKSLGFGWFVGLGMGVEYVGEVGFQLGIQYQFSYLNFKLAIGANGSSAAFSLKLFLGQPSKHQFGFGMSSFSESSEISLSSTSTKDFYDQVSSFETTEYKDTSLLYIYDIGQLKGFQLHGGIGWLSTSISSNNSVKNRDGIGGSIGIHYLF